MSISTATAKPSRRRQEDRTADTRRRILDATIACLHRVGYSAVTIAMVATEAGVSRGIISYHFASKADLMVAVRDAVNLDERRLIHEARSELGSDAYLREMPGFVLAAMRRPPALAVNEILLAARADSELHAKLRLKEKEIETRAEEELRTFYAELNIDPPPNLAIFMRVAVAACRGLAIAELVQDKDAEIEACSDYLLQLLSSADQRQNTARDSEPDNM